MANLPNRQSIRLKNFDYRTPGPYFVTVALHHRIPLFGHVDDDGILNPNAAGRMIAFTWEQLSLRYPGTEIDALVVMPDHFHAIITLGLDAKNEPITSLGDVIRWFKNMTGKRYAEGVAAHGWPRYNRFLWQRGYYEHVIRNQADLLEKQRYIEANPSRWLESRRG